MKEVSIYRYERTKDQGILGQLVTEGFYCKILELPWKNNKSNISCIPEGEYSVKVRKSKKFGIVYWLTDVADRLWILMHSGNLAGDTKKGYITHSHGCLLYGKYVGELRNQIAVLCSKPTLRAFMKYMEYKPFLLRIKNVY